MRRLRSHLEREKLHSICLALLSLSVCATYTNVRPSVLRGAEVHATPLLCASSNLTGLGVGGGPG